MRTRYSHFFQYQTLLVRPDEGVKDNVTMIRIIKDPQWTMFQKSSYQIQSAGTRDSYSDGDVEHRDTGANERTRCAFVILGMCMDVI
jgi:hypothetical protein